MHPYTDIVPSAVYPSPRLITSDHIWSHLIMADHSWSHLITSDHGWSQLGTSDHICSHLITSDHIWSHLITSGHIWSWLITAGSTLSPTSGDHSKGDHHEIWPTPSVIGTSSSSILQFWFQYTTVLIPDNHPTKLCHGDSIAATTMRTHSEDMIILQWNNHHFIGCPPAVTTPQRQAAEPQQLWEPDQWLY